MVLQLIFVKLNSDFVWMNAVVVSKLHFGSILETLEDFLIIPGSYESMSSAVNYNA